MFDERLLERIQHLETNPDVRVERNITHKIHSIMNHLQNLLNTHQGNVLIAEDYGIPEIINTHGESITEMTRRLENTLQDVITKYEPRLSNVRVKLISQEDDVLSLRFKLDAVLIEYNSIPVVLETVISSEGKVNISE